MESKRDPQRELIDKFPRLFRNEQPELGIEIGVGWLQILTRLFRQIDETLTDEQAKRITVRQVKQKFAGLRVYYSVDEQRKLTLDIISNDGVQTIRPAPSDEDGFPGSKIDALIWQAAADARVTCEWCGAPGSLRGAAWIHVACDRCERELVNRYNDG